MHVIQCFLECLEILYHQLEIVIQGLLLEDLLLGKAIELLLIKFYFYHSFKFAKVEFISQLYHSFFKNV